MLVFWGSTIMNHPDPALAQEVRRMEAEARTTILDTILLESRTYINNYISCYEKRYGPLEEIPKGSVITLDEFEEIHPGGSTSFQEIFVKAIVGTCGRVVKRPMKLEICYIADQMELFMKFTVMKYGVQTLYETCMEFLTLQVRNYLAVCDSIHLFGEYCNVNNGIPPRIPAGPHYPF